MYKNIFLVVSLFCAATVLFQEAAAVCGACEMNGAACINETYFHMCSKGVAEKSEEYSCPPGLVCSSQNSICVDPNIPGNAIECAPRENCPGCRPGKLFVCISRDKFAVCNGNTRSDEGRCPEGLFCTNKGELCTEDPDYECDSS